MKTPAAVLVETGKPLEILELEIPELKPGQALVEVNYSGVCFTQVLECRGDQGKDAFLPHCLGHEGSGTVLEVGPGVSKIRPGEKVILSWMKGGGTDVPGTVYQSGGTKVNAGGVTTFSRLSVVSENRLTSLPEGIDLTGAAMLGCAVPTGAGAVLNTAGAKAGDRIIVFGVGGIGLCALQAAVIAGCSTIVAVDVLEEKLELARRLGATHTISAKTENVPARIAEISKGGVDIAIEATGRPAVMTQALESVRNQGGIAVVIGNAHHEERIMLDPKQLNMGKQLRGTWGGDNAPDRDFPRYCDFLREGKLQVSPLISKVYALTEINDALRDLEMGKVTRPLIDLGLSRS